MLIEVFHENVNEKFTNITERFSTFAFIVKALSTDDTNIINCGILHLNIDYPGIGTVRLFSKIILLNQPHLVRFERLNMAFSLVFEKLNSFSAIDLQIYRETMPLEFEPQQSSNKGSTTGGTPVNTSASSISLLAANPSRKAMRIINYSNKDLYLNFGATASLASFVAKLPKLPASGIASAYDDDTYTGIVSGIWESAGSGSALVYEVLP